MSSTKIRSSNQLLVDANFDFNSNQGINLSAGVNGTDAVNKSQMDTAIGNAVSGLGNSLHAPVADLAAAKAVPAVERADKMLMHIETLGLYRFDAESSVASNDSTVIRPTDIASDATAGRWLQLTSIMSSHELLSGLLGGAANDHQHLTTAQLTKLNGIEAGADVTDEQNVSAVLNAVAAKTTPVDADTMPIMDSAAGNALKKATWANIKATLKTYFDTLYNKYVHPNHSGDVTSVADGATTIAANVVSNTKLADMAALTLKGNNTGAAADPADLTVAQVRTLLGITSGGTSTRTYRATPTGTVNGSNVTFTIAALVLSGTEEVYKNGLLMNAGAGNDYTISYGATTTITFATAPSNTPFTDVILVSYSV
jgi:hypothetical protein